MVGGFTFQADGSLLLFMDRGAVVVWRDGKIVETIIEQLPDEHDTRFNDVIADPQGRVYCGTMPGKQRPARLYRLDRNGSISLLVEGVGLSNGMGFTPDLQRFYHTDTHKHTIFLYDYDQATGQLHNQRPFATVPQNPGEGGPDGMTVDAAGDVWSARWDGSCLVRYAPNGAEKQRLAFPAPKVSSVTFGGQGYTDMYVTTAGGGQKDKDGPVAGALFRVAMGATGVHGSAPFLSRIGM
jgi:D-xylonolactonase